MEPHVEWLRMANDKTRYRAVTPGLAQPIRRWLWLAERDLRAWYAEQSAHTVVERGPVAYSGDYAINMKENTHVHPGY